MPDPIIDARLARDLSKRSDAGAATDLEAEAVRKRQLKKAQRDFDAWARKMRRSMNHVITGGQKTRFYYLGLYIDRLEQEQKDA